MARPPKKRRVEQIPKVKFFKPAGIPKRNLNEVALNIEEVEKLLIRKALDKNFGNITEAAKELGLTRSSLYRRLEKYDL